MRVAERRKESRKHRLDADKPLPRRKGLPSADTLAIVKVLALHPANSLLDALLKREEMVRARILRRKRRLGKLTPSEKMEYRALHTILDRPSQEELDHLNKQLEKDRLRFRRLLDQFDVLVKNLAKKKNG